MHKKIKEIRAVTGLSQAKFCTWLESEGVKIPLSTYEKWEAGNYVPAEYIVDLLEYFVTNKRKGL